MIRTRPLLFEESCSYTTESISKRLSDLSSNIELFQKTASLYFEALKNNGFIEPLVFISKTNTSDSTNKKQRKRKIICINPPFNNKRPLRPRTTEYGCNCRTRENSPLQNQYLTPNLIYQAGVENNANKGTKIYFDLAEPSFKARFANYNKDFDHEQYKEAQNCQNIYGR